MPLQYDKRNTGSVKQAIILIKAEHITARIMSVLAEFYKGSDLEPFLEIGLEENIETELKIILNEF